MSNEDQPRGIRGLPDAGPPKRAFTPAAKPPSATSHPYGCNWVPSFDTKHEARDFVVIQQRAGHVKRCEHTAVKDIYDTVSHVGRFYVNCTMDSFRYERDPDPSIRQFFGCPPTCHYFSSLRRARARGWMKARLSDAVIPIAAIARWFASLAPLAQTLIVLTILVAVIGRVAPEVLKAITELAKQLFNK